jgi:hypothetical protein
MPGKNQFTRQSRAAAVAHRDRADGFLMIHLAAPCGQLLGRTTRGGQSNVDLKRPP